MARLKITKEEADGGEEGGGGGKAAGQEEELQQEQKKGQLDDVIKLVERVNGLKNHVNEPHAAQEALRLLEEGRSRGIKDRRMYNSVLRVRGRAEL